MSISAILADRSNEIVTVSRDTKVIDAIALLAERRIGAMPVMEGGRVVGIFSERDVIYCLKKEGADVLNAPVSRAMTAPVFSAEPDMPLLTALALMTKRRIRHLPVIEDDRLIGFVSIGDIVKMRIERIEGEAAALRDYIQMA